MEFPNFMPHLGIAIIFILSQLVSVFVAIPFKEAGFRVFENPENPTNIFQIFLILLIFTVILLLIAKYKENLIRYIILSFFFLTSLTIFQALFYLINKDLSFLFSLIISISMLILFIKYPEWYVIDFFAIFLAGGISAMFAISIAIPYIILLLIILAIYDAISVHKTKHMVRLAETIVTTNLPLLVIFPRKTKYSYLKSKFADKEAVYMGLGDIIIPGILISASYMEKGLFGFVATLAGALLGFFILMKLISKSPQPGLPYLNGGVILAYIIAHFTI